MDVMQQQHHDFADRYVSSKTRSIIFSFLYYGILLFDKRRECFVSAKYDYLYSNPLFLYWLNYRGGLLQTIHNLLVQDIKVKFMKLDCICED